MMQGNWDAMAAFMPLMMLVMLLFWTAAIVGIVVIVRWVWSRLARDDQGVNAIEIVRRRYARGELSSEEYRRLRDDVTSGGGTT